MIRSIEEKITSEISELKLASSDLRQGLNDQEEYGEMIIANFGAMRMGIGLDLESIIETPILEDIKMYLLQSGSKQSVERMIWICLAWMMMKR